MIVKLVGHVFFTYMNFFMKLRLLLLPQIDTRGIYDQCYKYNRGVRTSLKSDLLDFVFSLGHILYSISFVAMIYIEYQI